MNKRKWYFILLVIIGFMLVVPAFSVFAAPAESKKPFFPERSKDGKTYTLVFGDLYTIEGMKPANRHVQRQLDACKIMYSSDYKNIATVEFVMFGGSKSFSQTLRRVQFKQDRYSPSGSYAIRC